MIAYGKLYRQLVQQDMAVFLALGVSTDISAMYWKVIQGASEDVAKNVSGEFSQPHFHSLAEADDDR